MEPFNSAAFSLGLETGCHGYPGFLQLMGGSCVALVSWGLSRVKHEMEACGCGDAVLGNGRSPGQFPTALELNFISSCIHLAISLFLNTGTFCPSPTVQ